MDAGVFMDVFVDVRLCEDKCSPARAYDTRLQACGKSPLRYAFVSWVFWTTCCSSMPYINLARSRYEPGFIYPDRNPKTDK